MAQMNDTIIPKGTLPLVGLLIGFSLVVVIVAVLMPDDDKRSPLDGAVRAAEMRFADMADGGIAVTTADGVTILPPDTNGFVRGAMRAMAFERKTRGLGPEDPFVLVENAKGRIELVDPEVGTRIDLRAFGADNERAFYALMPLDALRPTTTAAALALSPTTSRE